MLSDSALTGERLLSELKSDVSSDRKLRAVQTLDGITRTTDSLELREAFLDDLILLASSGSLDTSVENELAYLLSLWIPSTGVAVTERDRILARASQANSNTHEWIRVLGVIHGRKEVFLLLRLADSQDLQRSVHAELRQSLWPGLWPSIQSWLKDDRHVEEVLTYRLLSQTDKGRELLRQFIAEPNNAIRLRRIAVEQLKSTVAGVDLLLEVSDSQAQMLGVIVDRQELLSERQVIRKEYAEGIWNELLEGAYVEIPDNLELQEDIRELNARAIELLSPSAVSRPPEWVNDQEPGQALAELVDVVVREPRLVGCPAIARRLVPLKFGRIPPESMPTYRKMLRSHDDIVRYWGCMALLSYSSDREAIRCSLQLLLKSGRPKSSNQRPGLLTLLSQKFAVNCFWDAREWSQWLADERQFETGTSEL